MTKPQIKSKTNWFGVLVMALGVVQATLPELRPLLGDYYGLVLMAVGVGVIVLRQFTTGPVK